jgi:hypothetical protein
MLQKIGLGLLTLLLLAFVVLNALAWAGVLVDEDAATQQRPTAVARAKTWPMAVFTSPDS